MTGMIYASPFAARIATGAFRRRAIQKPDELAQFIDFIYYRYGKYPLSMLEVGSAAGGTLWAWSQIAERVYAVDLPGAPYSAGQQLTPETSYGATVIVGDSHDRDTLHRLRAALVGRPLDVVFIDGDHTYEGVRQDFIMYAPLTRPGGIVAFHDICTHPGMPDVQVERFWGELKSGHYGNHCHEIISAPATWGGIGYLVMP